MNLTDLCTTWAVCFCEKASTRMRSVSRVCVAILFHGSSCLKDCVDGCQRFGLLGGASSASQAGKEWVCDIHPPFSLAGLLS